MTKQFKIMEINEAREWLREVDSCDFPPSQDAYCETCGDSVQADVLIMDAPQVNHDAAKLLLRLLDQEEARVRAEGAQDSAGAFLR